MIYVMGYYIYALCIPLCIINLGSHSALVIVSNTVQVFLYNVPMSFEYRASSGNAGSCSKSISSLSTTLFSIMSALIHIPVSSVEEFPFSLHPHQHLYCLLDNRHYDMGEVIYFCSFDL